MPDYLTVPEERRARAIHEKARARRRGELHWLRDYIADTLDDSLPNEALIVRFVDRQFPALAARHGWVIEDDPRRIGALLGLRGDHTRIAIARLIDLGRIIRHAGGERLSTGDLQLPLSAEPAPTKRPASAEDSSSQRLAAKDDSPDSAQPSDTDAEPASQRLAQTRAEQRREELEPQGSTNGTSVAPATQEIVHRMIALAARGDTHSAGVIRTETQGLPEHALARALESLLGRRPRPRNPAGYLVQTLRSIRAELGLEPPATIHREPPL